MQHLDRIGLEALMAMAPMLRELGMHAQIWVHAPDLVELAAQLEGLVWGSDWPHPNYFDPACT